MKKKLSILLVLTLIISLFIQVPSSKSLAKEEDVPDSANSNVTTSGEEETVYTDSLVNPYLPTDYIEANTYNSDYDVSAEDIDVNSATTTISSYSELVSYLREQMVNRNTSVQIMFNSNSFTFSQVKDAIYDAFKYDETMSAKQGDYIRFNFASYYGNCSIIGNLCVANLSFAYNTTASQEAYVDARVTQIIENKGWRSLNEYEKILAVNNYIRLITEYDNSLSKFSAYNAINGSAVCQGYALLTYRFLRELNVGCRVIPSTPSGNHAYNLVRINGLWYNLDVTWNDSYKSNAFFLLTDESFLNKTNSGSKDSHTRDDNYRTTAFYNEFPMASSDFNPATDNPGIACVIPISYMTHVQDIGDQAYVHDGATSGTSGQSKRLEAIRIKLDNYSNLGVTYRTHVQDIGWQGWKSNGDLSGTSGMSKRLEAIQINLTGTDASKYDIYYRVHAQELGWLGWAKNGGYAGTAGLSYRLEAIQIVILTKGSAAPGSTALSFVEYGKYGSTATSDTTGMVNYMTHVQDYGNQSWVFDGSYSGTFNESKRLEAIYIKLGNTGYTGGITYNTHVQDYGWLPESSNGAFNGTKGESKRLEAIHIHLTGEVANHYDIYYRVHAQDFGWLGWAKNGAPAGTAGYSKRLESIQIVLVPKDSAAPGSTYNSFIQ